MDPSYPTERLVAMVEDSGTSIVIAASHDEPNLAELRSLIEIVPYDTLSVTQDAIVSPVPIAIDPESLAYVIFTSGSTGRPKGVAMPHRALANLIEWQLARETFKAQARVLQYSSLSFDVSFQELFSTWASGGHLHLISDNDRRDPRRLLENLEQHRIERLFLPYVALRQMVEIAQATGRAPPELRRAHHRGGATSRRRHAARLLWIVGGRISRQSVRPV